MAAKKLNWCRTCGKQYKVCYTCQNVKSYMPYRIICDTAAHYQIFLLIQEYRKGIITKETALEMLRAIPLEVGEEKTFLPDVQKCLQEIREADVQNIAKAQKSDVILKDTNKVEVKKQKNKGGTE